MTMPPFSVYLGLGVSLLVIGLGYLLSRPSKGVPPVQDDMAGCDQTALLSTCLEQVNESLGRAHQLEARRYDIVGEAERIIVNRWHNGESGVRA